MWGSLFWVVWFSFSPFFISPFLLSIPPFSFFLSSLGKHRKYRAKPETYILDSTRPTYICIVHWERRALNHCTSPRSSKKEILATLTLLCMVLPFFFFDHSPLKVDTHRCELVCDSVSTHGNGWNRFLNSGPRPLPSCFKGNHLSLRAVIRKLCGQSLKRQSDRAALSHGVSIS